MKYMSEFDEFYEMEMSPTDFNIKKTQQKSEIIKNEKRLTTVKKMTDKKCQTDSYDDQSIFEIIVFSLIERFHFLGDIRFEPMQYMKMFYEFLKFEESIKKFIEKLDK